MDLDGLAGLRAEFNARGWTRKATGRLAAGFVLGLVIAIAGYLVFLLAQPLWLRLLGLAVSTYGSLAVATNTHTWTHGGGSSKRWVNNFFGYLGYPVFLNLSLTYWKHSHITVHHTSPNVMGVDGDCEFPPFFVSTDRELERTSGAARFYYQRLQAYFFPVIVWVHGFLRQRRSWMFIVEHLRDPAKRRRSHWIDLGCMLLHWLLWIGIPALFLPLGEVVLASVCRIAAIGYPLFAVLAPAHYPHEAGCITKGPWAKDFLTLQTATTVNFRTGFLGSFACSGLQYQIEHHLFPSYSHIYYPAMAPLVRRFCEERDLPYRTMGWAESLWKVFRIFAVPKQEAPDPETLRARIHRQEI